MRARVFAIAAVGALAACSAPQPTITEATWEVINVWTSPDTPAAVPHGGSLAFGEASLAGTTGCSPIQGAVTFTRDGDTVAAKDAEAVTIDRIEIEPAPANCRAAWTHEQLSSLLVPGATFDLHQPNDSELTLTLRGEEIDRPAIGLSSLS
ncbi:hypothetical protein CATRI_11310 [Corynebacterium atrinae]|uniref:hypothetical protein n=1 Tax=Corynebacterium atrinae TaxID=1336740 RepID=UPI0025B48374|nr:hypothetical protein [Corynebacterium atrinae]WJY64311.1 hypothetical protein CATRI_11310 [Corynebacterium atrinae]